MPNLLEHRLSPFNTATPRLPTDIHTYSNLPADSPKIIRNSTRSPPSSTKPQLPSTKPPEHPLNPTYHSLLFKIYQEELRVLYADKGFKTPDKSGDDETVGILHIHVL
jgi:hypothetical protein